MGTTFKIQHFEFKDRSYFPSDVIFFCCPKTCLYHGCSSNVLFRVMRIEKATVEILESTFKYYKSAAEVSQRPVLYHAW